MLSFSINYNLAVKSNRIFCFVKNCFIFANRKWTDLIVSYPEKDPELGLQPRKKVLNPVSLFSAIHLDFPLSVYKF
jgi:hypothetical protein